MIWQSGASSSPYASNQVFDLREELHGLLYGDQLNPGIGQRVLLRRLTPKVCVCFDTLRGSPNPSCKYCQGEGYLWIETLNTSYLAKNFGSVQNPANVISRENFLAPTGFVDENRALAYFEYTDFPDYERYTIPTIKQPDSLYELKVDFDGRLVQPVVRVAKWAIRSLTPHRGDFGRVQFVELGLEKVFF